MKRPAEPGLPGGGGVQGLQDVTKLEEHKMIKLVETLTHCGTTWRKRYYMDGKRVSEAEWAGTFNNVYKTPDDVANARCDVECTGVNKVRYTWYA